MTESKAMIKEIYELANGEIYMMDAWEALLTGGEYKVRNADYNVVYRGDYGCCCAFIRKRIFNARYGTPERHK